MSRLLLLAAVAALPALASLAAERTMKYPPTRKVDQVDDHHGTRVADPYRWLEDDVRKSKDVAEWVDSPQELAAGTVVVLDLARSNQVIASKRRYDSHVAGVVSLKPGVALGEGGEGRVLVATTGRVKVKVDATNGPINIGDLLVTSDKQGVAMKSMPVKVGGGMRIHQPGTLIGKALEPLQKGTGQILVLLSLQ